jgi:hypothetical protein
MRHEPNVPRHDQWDNRSRRVLVWLTDRSHPAIEPAAPRAQLLVVYVVMSVSVNNVRFRLEQAID